MSAPVAPEAGASAGDTYAINTSLESSFNGKRFVPLPLRRPFRESVAAFLSFHRGSFTLLGLGDGQEDDFEQQTRVLDCLVLISSLRLSVSFGSLSWAAESRHIIDTNCTGLGTALLTFCCYSSFGDLAGTMSAALTSMALSSTTCADQLYYLNWVCHKSIRTPFMFVVFTSYMWVFATLLEIYVRCLHFHDKELYPDRNYEFDADSVGSRSVIIALVCAASVLIVLPGHQFPVASLISRLYQSHTHFSNFTVKPDRDDNVAPWFADPGADELRAYLKQYREDWGCGKGIFNNPNPEQFKKFVLHKIRVKGHGALSYLALRKMESVFEEYVQEKLREESVMIDKGDVLTSKRG